MGIVFLPTGGFIHTYRSNAYSEDYSNISVSADGKTDRYFQTKKEQRDRVLNGTREISLYDKIFRPYHDALWYLEKVGLLGDAAVGAVCVGLRAAERRGYVITGRDSIGNMTFKPTKGYSYERIFAFLKDKIFDSKVLERAPDCHFIEEQPATPSSLKKAEREGKKAAKRTLKAIKKGKFVPISISGKIDLRHY